MSAMYAIGLPCLLWAKPWRRLIWKMTRKWHWGVPLFLVEVPEVKEFVEIIRHGR